MRLRILAVGVLCAFGLMSTGVQGRNSDLPRSLKIADYEAFVKTAKVKALADAQKVKWVVNERAAIKRLAVPFTLRVKTVLLVRDRRTNRIAPKEKRIQKVGKTRVFYFDGSSDIRADIEATDWERLHLIGKPAALAAVVAARKKKLANRIEVLAHERLENAKDAAGYTVTFLRTMIRFEGVFRHPSEFGHRKLKVEVSIHSNATVVGRQDQQGRDIEGGGLIPSHVTIRLLNENKQDFSALLIVNGKALCGSITLDRNGVPVRQARALSHEVRYSPKDLIPQGKADVEAILTLLARKSELRCYRAGDASWSLLQAGNIALEEDAVETVKCPECHGLKKIRQGLGLGKAVADEKMIKCSRCLHMIADDEGIERQVNTGRGQVAAGATVARAVLSFRLVTKTLVVPPKGAGRRLVVLYRPLLKLVARMHKEDAKRAELFAGKRHQCLKQIKDGVVLLGNVKDAEKRRDRINEALGKRADWFTRGEAGKDDQLGIKLWWQMEGAQIGDAEFPNRINRKKVLAYSPWKDGDIRGIRHNRYELFTMHYRMVELVTPFVKPRFKGDDARPDPAGGARKFLLQFAFNYYNRSREAQVFAPHVRIVFKSDLPKILNLPQPKAELAFKPVFTAKSGGKGHFLAVYELPVQHVLAPIKSITLKDMTVASPKTLDDKKLENRKAQSLSQDR